ncbi:hypothetical protein [Halomonas mongoliensis]|uniref:hypothetical protein n=1 Tax=Halomonas mongoliensis TaxID=321265 RepID=UPI00403B1AC3
MPLSRSEFPAQPAETYSNLRKQVQHGDILLCSGNGVFSAMIQQATDSVWSHVGFILRLDDVDRVMLLESVESIGVRTVRLSKYLVNYSKGKPYNGGLVVIRNKGFSRVVQEGMLKKLAGYAIDHFGYPYDKRQIAKISARIMASKVPFTRRQRGRIRQNDEFICSEYVARCYAEVGIKVKWDKRGFISPADFACDEAFELVGVMQEN